MRTILAALLAAIALPAAAQRLATDTYDISIDVRCAEGVVGCHDVRYTAVHRRTGKTLRLRGAESHTLCADGVTPCRFIGYAFKQGGTTHRVWDNGRLVVSRDGKVVLEEPGMWVEDDDKISWHGRWRSYTEAGKEGLLCKTETAGEKGRRFVVQVEDGGGNAWFYFEAGAEASLAKDDEMMFRIDGKRPKLYDYDVSVIPGARAKVAMPNGYTPEFVRSMRAGRWITVLRAGSGPAQAMDQFSLTGFSAGFRKLAEWCRFDPDRLFQP